MSIKNIRLASIAVAAALLAAPISWAQIAPYSEDFEALDALSGSALGDVGWLVGATIFDPAGTYLYDYFAFPAPNGTGAFSNVATGEGGAAQGAQQLVAFSDYGNAAEHSAGNTVDALVFQERILVAADAGTWTFQFDAKRGDLAGEATARAFLKTLDPAAGFATTSLVEHDTTSLPATWGTFTLAVDIDASQAGELLQFGFGSRATSFDPSGVLYDNVNFNQGTDSDGDGIGDDVDNCTNVANADQRDTNGDGFGNICDTDLNDDCVSNPLDLGLFKLVFFTSDADADFNGDGVVNPIDLGIFKSRFFMAPGPNASGVCP